MAEPLVRTTCPYCGVGCGVLASPTGVAGDPLHPANAGRLCSKGTALAETLSLEGRLLHPEIDGRRVTWDAALDRVADGFARTIDRHGTDSVALYVSGQLLTEDYYAANKFAKGVLGTGNIDSNSRLCMASAVAAHRRAFGEDVVPGIYEDLEVADLIVLVGSNTAWCHPVVFQRIVAAKAERPGLRVVVVDPRRTATTEGADLHLPIAPGTDVALFTGLLRHLADARAVDPGYARHLDGIDDAIAQGAGLNETALRCGLRRSDLKQFFDWFTATDRTVTLFSQGVNQSSAGTDKANAIINVHLFTGRIGRPGASPFSITGQPNAMGGREVGALSNMLAAHLDWNRPGDADLLHEVWGTPRMAPRPGLKAVDLFGAIGDGRVRAVWIIGTNPAVSLPDAKAVRDALRGCEHVVVSDCMRETDTMDLATIRLPALAWGEKDGTVTNSERVISRQRIFLPPPGEARADWWAIVQVARRMGAGETFGWAGPADIFREHAALSGARNEGRRVFDISALATLTDDEYDAMRPTRWPCPAGRNAPDRLFGDGRFPTPSGRARMVATPFRAPERAVDAAWPFALLTGRVRDQWHTMTRTGKAPRLFAHIPEPMVSIHPSDGIDLPDGGLARVDSVYGGGVFRVQHDPGLRRGCASVPMHWTDRFAPSGRVNPVVNRAVDPISGQPELKHTPVRVTAFSPAWHGFVLARTRLGTELAPWSAIWPAGAAVWRHEIAGDGPAADAFAALRDLCDGPGAWLRLEDAAAGVWRGVLVRDHRLHACVFLGPTHALPPRDWLVARFDDARLDRADRRALLAGQPASGAAPDPAICVCHGVSRTRIEATIRAGHTTVASIGEVTRAGTNCGSCRPELRGLIAAIAALEPA